MNGDEKKGWGFALLALLAIFGTPAVALAGIWPAIGPLVILAACAGLAAGGYLEASRRSR